MYADRGLYWEQERTLIVADLHLGKTGHFRRSGIAMPQSVYKADLQRLIALLHLTGAKRLLIAGDLTHSSANRELELFRKWRNDLPGLQIDLVRGNHDILGPEWYHDCGITLHDREWRFGGFRFVHDPADAGSHEEFVFSGHVHPAITIRGGGRQSLTFPCFYYHGHQVWLPAFSHFTGTCQVRPNRSDTVYAVTPTGIVQVH